MRKCLVDGSLPALSGALVSASLLDDWLQQEFITPYTPEHNAISERFFRSLKEEYLW